MPDSTVETTIHQYKKSQYNSCNHIIIFIHHWTSSRSHQKKQNSFSEILPLYFIVLLLSATTSQLLTSTFVIYSQFVVYFGQQKQPPLVFYCFSFQPSSRELRKRAQSKGIGRHQVLQVILCLASTAKHPPMHPLLLHSGLPAIPDPFLCPNFVLFSLACFCIFI